VSYRRFARPEGRNWDVRQWVEWLRDQKVAPSLRSREDGTCSLCRSPTPVGERGTRFERCYKCQKDYSSVLDGFVPMCYSVHDGLEGVLWRAKNDPTATWLRLPLASLLCSFMEQHGECIERTYGGPFDIRVSIPSHSSTRRGVDHLEQVIDSVEGMHEQWDFGILRKNSSNKAADRRRRIDPTLFTSDASVAGKRVLLLDDTFTSGGTMASAAHALKQSGAKAVIGLTFGRQLAADWDNSQGLISTLPLRKLDIEDCVVHEILRPFI
jgi:hypothetical protein